MNSCLNGADRQTEANDFSDKSQVEVTCFFFVRMVQDMGHLGTLKQNFAPDVRDSFSSYSL